MWAEFGHVVGEERGFMAGAGNRDVARAGVELVQVDASIGVDQYVLRNEPVEDGEVRDSAAKEEASR